MATMSFAPTGHLQVLRDPPDESQDGIDIVLVPGIGTILPAEWPFAKEEWLATLPSSSAGTRVLAYEYASPFATAKPSWESILMLGHDLLQHVSDGRYSDATANKPILIVCHSLGGIIVKQALCVANKQFNRYESIINAIAGVIFLSTPHRYGDKTTSLIRFRDIFEATTSRNLNIPSTNIEQEGAILLDLADRFEKVSFSTPILSAYELRESKTSSTTLQHKYQQLVNREACSTRARMETVIGLNLNHHDTCLFTQSVGGESLPEFNNFVYNTLRAAARLFAIQLKDQESQDATTSAYSPTMSELPLKFKLNIYILPGYHRCRLVEQLGLTESPSNKATDGTSLSGFELVTPIAPKSDIVKPLHIPCFLLNTHSANQDFCGREDILERLATELLPPKNRVTASGTAIRQFALCGFGGIGKTEIAREFARRHKHPFDAVFWVLADEVAKLDHHYQQISLALGLEESSECKSQVVSREIVKGWLSNPRKHISGSDDFIQPGEASSEATWLLIFDNADEPIILADYWLQGSGSILITSPLSQQDSLSLFNHLTTVSNDLEVDTAQKISDALGGMAISQMAGIIRRQDLTLSEFFELYMDHEEHASPYETKFDTNLVTYRHSLSTVWAFGKLKPQTQQLLELISFLDPDSIGEDLLEASVELISEGTSFKKSNYIEARTDLLQSSLVQRDKQKQQISVHRIVQDVILATMDVEKKRSMFDQVSLTFSRYQKERGRTKQFDGFFETARSIRESSTHPDRDSLLADIHFCLGAIAMDASNFGTSRIHKERSFDLVSKICNELGTADDRLYLAYAERGISRIQDGRYEEGEADLKEALRIRKALGNYIPRSGEANLSWALLLQGKLKSPTHFFWIAWPAEKRL
ncbi:hypothetical protein DTO006G1_363 [Penicillium roqueforti]|uniref:uncharacterized protein n=1 Tax=Penicillium roqueforti TaxID=5082 RepID=UPI00190DA5BF|nr:uncharacterized protein LCP9604111_7723 [Penicillium roqueforti]KAF9243340.1 hypothetical protein LCP9604111_7723 [Penicillium roqueforti]KAI1833880.1 hypothetical protein CBS147337_5435 [Penicillium roqueforti]KAI2691965.1 hypothetical protein LCP963914a_59 [Penicillium roqueforti]KAI2718107.1 hypothetical protein CBS147318_4684 [Penicillium roqueforti]KAI2722279.1 hypothetical protein CBS147354_5571 [Penicillium roqueforti]